MIEEIFNSAFDLLKLSAIAKLDIVGLLQIFLLVIIVLVFYFKIIKNTSSEKLVNGIFGTIVALWLLSELLKVANLTILSGALQAITFTVILSMVVIFQPELRRFMGYLGQKRFWDNYIHKKNNTPNNVNPIKELLEAVKHLKKTRTGALIVIQEKESVSTFTEVGTKLNAIISTPLLLTIFHPNTPLHDGAIIIENDIISSAGVLLPLTDDPKLSWKYGTRHRAAIGMSEVCDCACLVVSEETGDVSIAMDGTLKKYDDFTLLKSDLENIMGYGEDTNDSAGFFNFLPHRHKTENK